MPPSTSTSPDQVMRTCHCGHNMAVACWNTGKDGKKPYAKAAVVGATVFWLLCPNIARYISGLESKGAIRDWSAKVEADDDLRQRYIATHADYEQWVEQHLPQEAWEQFQKFHIHHRARKYGNAGVNVPHAVKCLHAQVAMYLAGLPNPVGEAIVKDIVAMHNQSPTLPGCGESETRETEGRTKEAAVEAEPSSGENPPQPVGALDVDTLLRTYDLCTLCRHAHAGAS
eukprot:GGOE01049393.1.p1 GENE.GGOE01049393.1~~GGOE01049393.1.p1  ORF type:complete len:228 (+),score=71.09 GGOE01049393.1:43-726(+)